jgi:hypothetical protein
VSDQSQKGLRADLGTNDEDGEVQLPQVLQVELVSLQKLEKLLKEKTSS